MLSDKRINFESVISTVDEHRPIIQSEVNQRKKANNHILRHIYEIYKNGSDELTCKEGMETQMKRTDLWPQVGRGGWDEWKRSIDIYTVSCVKQIAIGEVLC